MQPPKELLDVHEHLSEALVSLARTLSKLPEDGEPIGRIARLLTEAQAVLGELTRDVRGVTSAKGR